MTVKLPEKAGFVATPDEWDALVRIAENLAAQVVQRDAALRLAQAERDAARQHSPHNYVHKAMFDQVVEQRDAARAEVARLTAALKEYGWHLDNCPAADCSTTKCECGYAALRQPAPAPAPAKDDARDAMIEILDDEPAPAGGEAK